jgi:FKBP-type peptidyl-prolyl cis-trans isomerase
MSYICIHIKKISHIMPPIESQYKTRNQEFLQEYAQRPGELITGWNTALREMPAGSRWEIVIPYHLGYGTRQAGVIKPYSTLIFDITLLDVR